MCLIHVYFICVKYSLYAVQAYSDDPDKQQTWTLYVYLHSALGPQKATALVFLVEGGSTIQE